MSRGDRIKIIVAISALVLGGGLIAWNFGAFDSLFADRSDPNAKFTPDQLKEAERQQKRAKDQEKIAPPSGS